MQPPLSQICDGKKFMWDGAVYEQESGARDAAASYEKNGFETKVVSDSGNWLVYSRRVTQITAAQ